MRRPQVAPFGSVPLRTYLPDGDIDLCLLGSDELLLRDSWAEKLRAALESKAARSQDDDLQLGEVQIIHAEVRCRACHALAHPVAAATMGTGVLPFFLAQKAYPATLDAACTHRHRVCSLAGQDFEVHGRRRRG